MSKLIIRSINCIALSPVEASAGVFLMLKLAQFQTDRAIKKTDRQKPAGSAEAEDQGPV